LPLPVMQQPHHGNCVPSVKVSLRHLS
jgi:hypothetical protein